MTGGARSVRPAAWRVGLFTLAGTGLLALAIAWVGGRWFAATEAAVMRFEGSVWGLNVGAPVVFRGVRIGHVRSIGFAPAGEGASGLAVPVTADFDRALLQQLLAAAAAGPPPAAGEPVLQVLVARGLVARLAMQSLLTGQLYVDLDLDPARPAVARAAPPAGRAAAAGGPTGIPTMRTRLQTLQAQLEGLDLGRIGADLAAVAAAARTLLAHPDAGRLLGGAADAAQALQRLAQRLDRELVPLAQSGRATLGQTQRTLQQLGGAAAQIGGAASQVQALAAGGGPALAELQRAAGELGRAAAALRALAADDSSLRQNTDRALQDLSAAARALRALAELLERHPDALLRGRGVAP